jgi:alpha-glucosidase
MVLPWSLGSIVYHVYVRSFQDSNNDGIGDLQGLISRIPHIASLGANALWLSPIYLSPQADFGYDVADYTAIDPVYGTLQEFDELVSESHKRGIRVLMDYVPNHTSIEHNWFKESRASLHNPKRDWYIWKSPQKDGSLPNNWLSIFGGPAWEFDEITGEYYLHTFDKGQPDLNWRNPEVVDAMLQVLRFWLDRGVDGFRVDVPYHMFKDELFRDEPSNPNYIPGVHSEYESLLHIHTSWLPESFTMMTRFVEVLQEYDHTLMVSEAWGTMQDLVKLYKSVGWKYYMPFNFSLMTVPWTADLQKKYIDTYDRELGDAYMPCYVLGNHDRQRVASRLGLEQARVAAMLELTLRGIPFLYYGEEIGMTDAKIEKQQVLDPFEINSPGLGLGRDPQRTPMQWDNSTYAGFTRGKPWLPVNENYTMQNVIVQESEQSSFFSLYKLLIKLRKHHEALRIGSYTPVASPVDNVLVFLREYDSERILVILNFDGKEKDVTLSQFNKGKLLVSASMKEPENETITFTNLKLPGNEGYICLLE